MLKQEEVKRRIVWGLVFPPLLKPLLKSDQQMKISTLYVFVYVWIGWGGGVYVKVTDNKEHLNGLEMTSSESDSAQQEWEKLWKIKYWKTMEKRVILVVANFSCYIPEINRWLKFTLVCKTPPKFRVLEADRGNLLKSTSIVFVFCLRLLLTNLSLQPILFNLLLSILAPLVQNQRNLLMFFKGTLSCIWKEQQ